MSWWNHLRNAFVSSESRGKEVQEFDPKEALIQELKQDKETLREEKQELKEQLKRKEETIHRLQKQVQTNTNKLLETFKATKTTDKTSSEPKPRKHLTTRQKEIYQIIRDNSNRIQTLEDVQTILKQKHGTAPSTNTINSHISKIKKKGYGDLREYIRQ